MLGFAKLLTVHVHVIFLTEFIISLSESIILSTSIGLSPHSRIHAQSACALIFSAQIASLGSSARECLQVILWTILLLVCTSIILIQHVCQNILGVLQSLHHFKISAIHGRPERISSSFTTFVDIGHDFCF